MQVRYEMVRRHEVDGQVISEVAANFGVSRPTFYKAQAALGTTGLAGLLPGQRGPKAAHKLSAEILASDADLRASDPHISMSQRLDAIEDQFGVRVHRRSLERALGRKKMTRASPPVFAVQPAAAYETLRAAVLSGHSNDQRGLAIIIHRGLAAWVGELTSEAPPPTPSSIVSGRFIRPTAPASAPNELTRGLKVDYRSVWAFVHAEKLSYKKTLLAREQDRPDVARRRAQWRKYQGQIDPRRLVFIDG